MSPELIEAIVAIIALLGTCLGVLLRLVYQVGQFMAKMDSLNEWRSVSEPVQKKLVADVEELKRKAQIA